MAKMVRNCFQFCRIICVVLVMSGSFCVISLSSIIVIRYNANYLSTTMDNAHHSVADIPFPAVTLCHYNRIDIRKVDGAFDKWVAYLHCISTRSNIWLHSHRILCTMYTAFILNLLWNHSQLTSFTVHSHMHTQDSCRTLHISRRKCLICCCFVWMEFDSVRSVNFHKWTHTITGRWIISIYRRCIRL